MCKYASCYKYSDVFTRTELFMRLRHIIATFVLILACQASYAGPAGNSAVYIRQPDGSMFQAKIKGDEFTRIKTDTEGRAIIQEQDGWWCYAIYDADGTKRSSGWRVGSQTPSGILAQSSLIPYGELSERARERRRSSSIGGESSIYRRMKEQRGILTRSEEGEEPEGPMMKHGLVILASFKDIRFEHTKEEFESLLKEEGYSVNGATGSAKEYFDDQFGGLMEFEFHVSDIVTLSRNRTYYGSNDSDGNDKSPAEMIAEACRLADDEIDFSLYDDDKDGKVDNVFVFFAGEDEAEGADEECIWSHAWYIFSGAGIKLELDGTVIDRYACTSELTRAYDQEGNVHKFISGIGTFCHEYAHTLGLPDFYDTDYEESGGIAAGLWTKTSLMDGGNYNNLGNTPPYFNAIERIIAGISEPAVLEKTGTYTMDPVNMTGASYMIPTDDGNRFILLECRSNKGWDRFIGGSGMLAYMIDLTEGSYDGWLARNEVNTDPDNQKADLMEADGREDGFQTIEAFHAASSSIDGIFYPSGSTESINKGEKNSITSIRKDGDAIRFNFIGDDDIRIPPVAVNFTKDVFADAAIVKFESSYPYDGEAVALWGRPGADKDTLKVMPYATGKYSLTLEGLEPAGKTYEIDVVFISDGMESEKKKTSVMTKRMPSSSWPFIYLGSMERNSDGTFRSGVRSPLRVYGAAGAAEIRWEFNGKPINREGDGYYTLKESGILQATILWEDGSIDKVMKEIIISL